MLWILFTHTKIWNFLKQDSQTSKENNSVMLTGSLGLSFLIYLRSLASVVLGNEHGSWSQEGAFSSASPFSSCPPPLLGCRWGHSPSECIHHQHSKGDSTVGRKF